MVLNDSVSEAAASTVIVPVGAAALAPADPAGDDEDAVPLELEPQPVSRSDAAARAVINDRTGRRTGAPLIECCADRR
jgi:hypothetical protein